MTLSNPAPCRTSARFAFAPRRCHWHLLPLLFVAAVGPFATVCRAEKPLMLAEAVAAAAKNNIVPTLEDRGVTSVGVLKFLAMDGSGPNARLSTRIGAINSDLAAQFQLAILLNISLMAPIAVLRAPAAVAGRIDGATHLTADGLEKLFAAKYPVVVGRPTDGVRPDAFVFGTVQIADDLKTAKVDVRLVRRGAGAAETVCTFPARLGADDLPAAGQSFVANRGLFTGGQTGGPEPAPTPEQVAERPIKLASLAADVRAGRRAFPLEDPEAPVTLSITYDGVVQKIEVRKGQAFVAEPRQGQKVAITITKTSRDGRRYAVALKVNGENTTERNTLTDIKARKWVLSDDFMKLTVKGYSMDAEKMKPFTVLSAAESARRAFDYGVDAGTITMTVFAEQSGTPDASPVVQGGGSATAALDALLLAGGVRLDPNRAFETLDSAKGLLSESLNKKRGGIIVPSGETESLKQNRVPFEPIPDPVMSVVVRYYTRQ